MGHLRAYKPLMATYNIKLSCKSKASQLIFPSLYLRLASVYWLLVKASSARDGEYASFRPNRTDKEGLLKQTVSL